jgi:hypothetical protein
VEGGILSCESVAEDTGQYQHELLRTVESRNSPNNYRMVGAIAWPTIKLASGLQSHTTAAAIRLVGSVRGVLDEWSAILKLSVRCLSCCQIAKSLADGRLVPEYGLMGSHGDSIGTGNIEVCHLGPREARAPKNRVHF